MPSRSASEISAVTVDAFGTLLELEDPAGPLREALSGLGVQRTTEDVERAFAAEAAHYVPRSWRGRDERSLAKLRRECAAVFLAELRVELDPGDFVGPFVSALRFRAVDGGREALERLRAAGLRLACVSNWDYKLPEHLEAAGVVGSFDAIVTSAEAGAAKPDPGIFGVALARLGVEPGRALHIGDEDVDRRGARAAGLAFAPPPLVTLPARLGL